MYKLCSTNNYALPIYEHNIELEQQHLQIVCLNNDLLDIFTQMQVRVYTLIPVQRQSIPALIGLQAGCILDRLPVHYRVTHTKNKQTSKQIKNKTKHAQSCGQLRITNQHDMVWFCTVGGSQSTWKEPKQAQANSTKHLRISCKQRLYKHV